MGDGFRWLLFYPKREVEEASGMSSMIWKECTPRDGWWCRTLRPIHAADVSSLLHLYQPIVGTAAIGLYLTLAYQVPLHRPGASEVHSHLYLMNLLSLPLQDLLEARYRLEGVGLVNTYRSDKGERRLYEYEIIPPLCPERFFQSDVLSIALYNRLGKERYLTIRRKLFEGDGTYRTDARGKNVTKSFQRVFGSFSPAEISAAASVEKMWNPGVEPISREGKPPSFFSDEDDLAMIRMRLESVLDPDAWTEEVEMQLREIRFLYQLSDWDLLRALQNPYVTYNGRINLERLRNFVCNEYRIRFGGLPVVVNRNASPKEAHRDSPLPGGEGKEAVPSKEEDHLKRHLKELATISPLELLSHFQNGMRIPDADVELVERLIREYGLPYGVINVLLEYVMYTHDYKLPRPLVEKIAGHWKRRGVETVEQAYELARKELNWEWKRQKQQRKQTKDRSSRKGSDTEQLPRALVKQMEAERSGGLKSTEVDPRVKAEIMDELNRMRERFKEKRGST
jgi:replication initiation and membrane attachment protein